MEIQIVYITNHPSQQKANKKYREKNKELLNEKARTAYNENSEYKEKRKSQMREYMRRRKESQELKKNES